MISPNALLGQFASKQAHFKCHEQTFFPRHPPQNLKLDSVRPGTCIGDGHSRMLARSFVLETSLLTRPQSPPARPAVLSPTPPPPAVACPAIHETGPPRRQKTPKMAAARSWPVRG